MAVAYDLALNFREEGKWRQLRQLAQKHKKMDLAQNCHLHMIGFIKGKVLK